MSAIKYMVAAIALLFSSLSLAAVDLNTADAKTLAGVNGIGPAKASAIVDYRNANGGFRTIEDLVKVKGIGPKLLNKIRASVTVGDDKE